MLLPTILLIIPLNLFASKIPLIGFIFNWWWVNALLCIFFYIKFIDYYKSYIDSNNPLSYMKDIDRVNVDIKKLDSTIWNLRAQGDSKIRVIEEEIEPIKLGNFGEEFVTNIIKET